MEQRLTLITLGVSDLEKATHFYETSFGWKRSGTSNAQIVFFKLNGMLLALFPKEALAEDAGVPAGQDGIKNFTLAHNTRSEKEVDEIIADLKGKGVRIVKAPQKAAWGGYSGYVADVDNNLWEIAWNPFLPLDARGNVLEP